MTAVYMVAEYFMDPVTCPTLVYGVWEVLGWGMGMGVWGMEV